MDKKARIKDLVEILNKAAKSYYVDAVEIMPNIEYDKLYDELLEEHKTNMLYIQAVRDAQNSDDAINKSVLLAKHYQVDEKSIMQNADDVRKKLFGGQ